MSDIIEACQAIIETHGGDVMITRKKIKDLFLARDESHLYPINGEFNATKRALRRVAKLEMINGALDPLELAYAIDAELSNIVNGVI